jgi:ATP-dependent helicase Lhr and Lhr-like helicase
MNVLDTFHPAVANWFRRTYTTPTAPQLEAWPLIHSGRHVLIAAPTGSGKTLAAFLAAIDALVRLGVRNQLRDETRIVYVSPLKALSNDIHKNLEEPLAGIRQELIALGYPDVEIRTLVRTGDTPQAERDKMRRKPPHILVTTPESLYILVTSESGRKTLAPTRTVIVDEIHALAPNKRGAHLAISLERLEELTGQRLTRVGLSATQKPIEEVARFLVGSTERPARGLLDDLGAPVDLFDRDDVTPAEHPRGVGEPIPTPALPPDQVRGRLLKGREMEVAGLAQADQAQTAGATSDSPPLKVVSGCAILDTGHTRRRDLAIEVPESPLEAVMSAEVWGQVYERLVELINEHRSTLVFVNTRRLAERLARALSDRIGADQVTSHHGSLAREQRLNAEQKLKRGELKALVATSSLELGIDIGHVDLVCQISTPRAISALLQRVGRSGHAVGGLPKGRLFPLSRDDLVECAALLDAVRRGELDRLRMPDKPLDVLAQQIAAEVACRECDEDKLFALLRRAYPYRHLERAEFDAVVQMLAEGFSTRRGRSRAYLHRDAVNHQLRDRKGLRLTAITCGGTIPDTADYNVVLEPEQQIVGTVNEDFAVESMSGDIFQLGNTSYRILRVEAGRVRVEDARGLPPSIPFWLGEAPARTDEVSWSVSRLREEIEARRDGALEWLTTEVGIAAAAAEQIVDYYAAARAALGLLPTQKHLVFERFFDESGGTQLLIHSPFGSRINRAWGLSLRKRFCRKFNFELQAAATEDAIILSLTATHSFQLEEVARYLHSNSVRPLLVQALLDAPMFMTRWRWNASIALALLRFKGGNKVPPQLQRMEAEDLIAAVFPDQLACQENIVGDREIPDHPLVNQTIADCLHEAMDIDGMERLLRRLESGEIVVTGRNLTTPSPLALEILAARPYAFLDDAPLEERRTQAVIARRWLDPDSAADIGRLDPEAIARVREEAWPGAEDADELHDALLWLGYVTQAELAANPGWERLAFELAARKRATAIEANEALTLWAATERLPELLAVYPNAIPQPPVQVPAQYAQREWTREEALVELVRGRLEGLGPTTAVAIAESLGVPRTDIDVALLVLEGEGFAMRGSFTLHATETEWCERRLLARINRYTVKRLRQEIEPVGSADFLRFLFDWQHVTPDARMEGPDAVAAVISQLEGFEAAAAAWEAEILPARVSGYEPAWLDDLCLAGRVLWTRLEAPKPAPDRERGPSPVRTTPITLLTRKNLPIWSALVTAGGGEDLQLSARARAVADFLGLHGASFFDDIVHGLDLPRTFVEEALGELVAAGLVNSDGFSGLRALLLPSSQRKPFAGGRRRRTALFGVEDAGRWTLIRRQSGSSEAQKRSLPRETLEQIARALLKRYGVVFWRLLAREAEWLPPWRDLLMAYRRLETRGEIRGGRFVAGFSGEQFALPEAVGVLRGVRTEDKGGAQVCVSGTDPLNLVGILVPGAKVPALYSNRVLFRDGVAIAALIAGDAHYFVKLSPEEAWEARNVLLRGASALVASP